MRDYVNHAVRRLHADGPDLFGLIHSQPTAFDHRRASHADGGALGRDDHVAATEQRRVAGEAAAVDDADEWNESAQARECLKGLNVETGDGDVDLIRIAGPSAPALGEEHERAAQFGRKLK